MKLIREIKRLQIQILNLIIILKRILNIFDIIEIENFKFKVTPHHFWREFKKDGWEPETYESFKKNINHETTFIDIGAWVGVTTIWASLLGCKKIFSVEANPRSYKLLLKTIHANKTLNDFVTLTNKCISNSNGEMIKFGRKLSSNSMISDKGDYQVETITLPNYIKDINNLNHVFIKIDIEGAEELVIKDLVLLKNSIKNLKILLALHPSFWKNKKLVCSEILELSKEFQITYLSGENLPNERLEEMIMTKEKFPGWGTPYGNLFEIILDNSNFS